MINVVVADDDLALQRLIVEDLTEAGLHAVGVSNGRHLYQELLKRHVDIVVLDLELPDEDGFTIAKSLNSLVSLQSTGIIMLTSHGETVDRIKGLESGADVYLIKPVDLAELQAYIESLYRRLHRQSTNPHKTWLFDSAARKLITPSGTAIALTYLEERLIAIISENSGRPVHRRDIIVKAFEEDYLLYDGRRLEAIVSRLRKKIYAQYPLVQPIKVVHSVGYIFTEPLIHQH